MELPYDTEGDLDWNTLGNILTAHILGEVLHARYVDYKYGRVSRELRQAVDTSWQFSYEEDDIIVLKKINPNSPLHVFMGRGVIEMPMEDVVLFIKNISHREQWDKNLVDIAILRVLSTTDFLVHMHHRARRCLIRLERDWLYYERACYVDNQFVMTAMSVEHPDYPPRQGLTRAQILPGTGWVLEPYDGSSSSTLVSYVAHLDTMNLPPIIMNKIVQRQVMAIRDIRNILTPPTPPPSPLHGHRGNLQPSQCSSSGKELNQKRGERDNGTSAHSPLPRESDETERGGENGIIQDGQSGNGADSSGAHFEDPVSVYAFTRSNVDMKRMESVPWDVDHHWNGDTHSHTHLEAREVNTNTERLRSYSEGESASPHSIPVSQHSQHILAAVDETEDKGQLT